MASRRRRVAIALVSVLGSVGVLAIPGASPDSDTHAARGAPFRWNADARWDALERAFREARATPCARLESEIRARETALAHASDALAAARHAPHDPLFMQIEEQLFALAPRVAACPARLDAFLNAYATLRDRVKQQTRFWRTDDPEARARAYRLLYGGRAAVEEVLLQLPAGRMPSILRGVDEPSATPSALVHGVRIHSGDLLLSRGGAPTSALIARGNDRPGNFSHVALVHVDARSHEVTIVEAHIERGVVVSKLDEYLGDGKRRVLVLRPRADLEAIQRDPTLPHRAATFAHDEVTARHIAYDFAMDVADHEKKFCSEVAAAAYERFGLRLWEGLSTMSSRGLVAWLGAFGVEHFETEAPADLEYDPKLRVVVEWRDSRALFDDHVDNAVTDAMLEGAERGDALDYEPWMLPVARIMKAYSLVLNVFGREGPVPEGMSATVALRAKKMSARHARLSARVRDEAARFARDRGYRAPYWELVRMARRALAHDASR